MSFATTPPPKTPARKRVGANGPANLARTRLLARLRREYTPAVRAATLRLNAALPAETA